MFISGFASSSIAHVKYWGIVSVHLVVRVAVHLVSVHLVSVHLVVRVAVHLVVHLVSVNLAVRLVSVRLAVRLVVRVAVHLVSMVEFIGSMMVVYHMEDWFLIIDMNNPFGYFLN